MGETPIAEGLFEVVDGAPRLIGGRRKRDGITVFPMPAGPEGRLYDPVRLSAEGTLWSFTVQRFRPKSPPYAGADDEASFRPFAIGYVELPGEVIVESRLEVDDFAALRVGLPMRLALAPFALAGGETVTSYVFRPAA
ncbi:putative OB-fold protein [Caulobacter ginsengisoli]|uniref:OB-fold protein n=1 Tax=Caulobacter ginsengisoli TaxID=400775 RepID=A0ABU0IY28_9CAUL|nr:OB-fold domain-containing protein [Caulobacter ginsengisoli]MDQ0466913.1 putative OB-fold protein [Caulobacter ginsengisoli]